MSRRLGVTLALVGLVLLAAHARADDLSERIEDEERDSERLVRVLSPSLQPYCHRRRSDHRSGACTSPGFCWLGCISS